MIIVQPFRPGDEQELRLQPQQERELENFTPSWRAMLVASSNAGPAWTARLDGARLGTPGQLVGIGGLALFWKTRAHAWCFLANDIPMQVWPALHRAVRSRLDQVRAIGVVRVEAEVMQGFREGDRWVRMLGFEHEGVARCYGPGLQDFGRYGRITP